MKRKRSGPTVSKYLKAAADYFTFLAEVLQEDDQVGKDTKKHSTTATKLSCVFLVDPVRQAQYMRILDTRSARSDTGDFFTELRKFFLFRLSMHEENDRFRNILVSLEDHVKDQQ
jgi:hypothetical protein